MNFTFYSFREFSCKKRTGGGGIGSDAPIEIVERFGET